MIKLSAQFLTTAVIALTTAQAYGNATLSLPDIADRMDDIGKYCASAKFDVLMASHSEPVEYTVGLQCEPADGDTLSPCRYLIEWKLDTPSGEMKGFSAYFDGSHFRFRDRRLQEYHASDDPTPFAPSGAVSRGVQQQVQFADIIPAFMAQKFREMADDSTYIYTIAADTVFNGTPATVVKGVRRTGGYDGMEYTYVLDNKTMQPIHTYLETSPGGIGEQSIEVAYSPARPMLAVLDMESLRKIPRKHVLARQPSGTSDAADCRTDIHWRTICTHRRQSVPLSDSGGISGRWHRQHSGGNQRSTSGRGSRLSPDGCDMGIPQPQA